MADKILIINDDVSNLELLRIYLSKEGYEIEPATNGLKGIELLNKQKYSLIVLDIMMPELNGIETIKRIRKTHDTPTIFITAKDSQSDKVQGFLLGCDDYIVKPFDLMEMRLRIQAVLKRVNIKEKEKEKEVIIIDDLIINTVEHTVLLGDEKITLTSKEFEIILLLAKNRGRVFSVSEIYERIWEEPFLENDRSVLTHIGNIRDKLHDSVKLSRYIKTIWGVGYKIQK